MSSKLSSEQKKKSFVREHPFVSVGGLLIGLPLGLWTLKFANFLLSRRLLLYQRPPLLWLRRRRHAAGPRPRVPFEDHWIGGSPALHSWHVPSPSSSPASPFVLFLHGNSGDLALRSDWISLCASRLLLPLLCLSARGFGLSAGRPGERAAVADVGRALRDPLLSASSRPVVLYGHSLGANTALLAAAELPERERERVVAVVADSPFSNTPDMVKEFYGPKWAPERAAAAVGGERWDALAAAPRVRCPVLVIVAAQDALVPPSMGREIARKVPRGRVLEVAGSHDSTFLAPGYFGAISAFLEQAQKDMMKS